MQLNSTTSYKWCVDFIDNSLINYISIQRNEDIEIKFSGSTESVRVQKCLVVRHQNYVCPYLPLFFIKKKVSTLTTLTKWEDNWFLVIPTCSRSMFWFCTIANDPVSKGKRCICVDVCAIKRSYKSHPDVDCNICENNDLLKADIHADTNEFMAFDASFGFELDRWNFTKLITNSSFLSIFILQLFNLIFCWI